MSEFLFNVGERVVTWDDTGKEFAGEIRVRDSALIASPRDRMEPEPRYLVKLDAGPTLWRNENDIDAVPR